MTEEDIHPCNQKYWETRVFKYIVGLLHYDLTKDFDPLSPRIKENVLGVHRHLKECSGCGEGLIVVLQDLATDESIALNEELPQVPPENFAKFKRNQEYLDTII